MKYDIYRYLRIGLVVLAVLNLIFIFVFNGKIPGFIRNPAAQEEASEAVTEVAVEEPEVEKDPVQEPEKTEEEQEEEKVQRCRIIASSNVNMRSGPGTGNGVVSVLSPDTILIVTGEEENGWRPVRTEDGTEGYVFGNLTVLIEEAASEAASDAEDAD